MRRWKTGEMIGSWKRVYNEALSELEIRVRLEKIEIARTAILDEIEVALHAGSAHPGESGRRFESLSVLGGHAGELNYDLANSA